MLPSARSTPWSRTKRVVWVCSQGKAMVIPGVGGDGSSLCRVGCGQGYCAATSTYSCNVTLYIPSPCLHLTNAMSLESDLTCLQNTFSSPEPALLRAVHTVQGWDHGPRTFRRSYSVQDRDPSARTCSLREGEPYSSLTSAHRDVPRDVH